MRKGGDLSAFDSFGFIVVCADQEVKRLDGEITADWALLDVERFSEEWGDISVYAEQLANLVYAIIC